MLKVEAEAQFEGHRGAREITCIFFLIRVENLNKPSFFYHKGKSIHHSKLQIDLFMCTHNINKTFSKIKKIKRKI